MYLFLLGTCLYFRRASATLNLEIISKVSCQNLSAALIFPSVFLSSLTLLELLKHQTRILRWRILGHSAKCAEVNRLKSE